MEKSKTEYRCCVIGGAGFIGSNLVNELEKAKRRVSVIDIIPKSQTSFSSDVTYFQGDYGDKKFLSNALKGIDEIIYLAYSSVPNTSFIDPLEDLNGNLPRIINLLEIVSKIKVRKLIVISSGGTVYGMTIKKLIDEDHPTNPISPYGISKLALEKYALMYMHCHDVPVIIIRPSNAYGIGQKPFTGQGFIATAIASILQSEKITLFGEKGTVRDYIYIDDLTSGLISILNRGKNGEIYNLCSGVGISNKGILEYLNKLAIQSDMRVIIETLQPRKFDVPYNVLDSRKVRNEVGWEVKITFEKGIEKTWNWMQQLFNKDPFKV